ncbi:TonB-dependent receptor plug domain-containing protein [Helicobacter saguini]|nr:TonB-dependent receptor plug domain-containing protein [Helicobacter saguini]
MFWLGYSLLRGGGYLLAKDFVESKDLITLASAKSSKEVALSDGKSLQDIKVDSIESKQVMLSDGKFSKDLRADSIESKYKNAEALLSHNKAEKNSLSVMDKVDSIESKNIHSLTTSAKKGEVITMASADSTNIDSITLASVDSIKNIESKRQTSANKLDSITLASSETNKILTLADNSDNDSDTETSTNADNADVKANTAVLNKVVTSATGFSLPLKDEPKNIILIDKQDIEDKGYTNLEQALEKQPSVTFVQGPQGTKEIDIRGQGLDATRAVKILVNRVPINLNDTGNGGHTASAVTPFNQISIDDIESIEIIPGGGAVVYGNGTRGGVVNIVTKKPSKDYANFNLRGNLYENFTPFSAGAGAGVSGGKKIGDKFFVGASANYTYQNGVRPKEYTHNVYTSLNTYYQINEDSKLEWNISYSLMNRYFAGYQTRLTGSTTAGFTFKSFETMKNERYTSPAASQNSTGAVQQDFIQTSLNYTNKILENLDFDSILFYQFSYFRFPSQTLGSNTRSFLSNHAVGLNLKTKWSAGSNTLITGLDNQFEASDTLSKSASTDLENKGTKYSLSFYGLDSYKFGESFSLSGGARGEISYFTLAGHTGMANIFGTGASYYDVNAKKWQFGYALELTPSYNYSDTGAVYVKQEIGFISPSIRQAVSTDPSWTPVIGQVGPKVASDIKPEQYFTSELGWRDEFEYSYLSATLFYTHTLNEIRYNLYGFATEYYNIGATQRLGFEFSTKQDFMIADTLPLNLQESISYIYSNVLKGRETGMTRPGPSTSGRPSSSGALEEGKPVPYVPLLKLALLMDAEVLSKGKHTLKVFWNNTYYGNQVDNNQFDMNPNGYVLSDLGLNYKMGDLHISAGIRNLFDSFYIAYQNTSVNATSGALSGAGTYLAGEGRNYFLEGRYSF